MATFKICQCPTPSQHLHPTTWSKNSPWLKFGGLLTCLPPASGLAHFALFPTQQPVWTSGDAQPQPQSFQAPPHLE